MAEAVPFGIATEMLLKLGSSVFHEIGSAYGLERELQRLENTLSTIKAALLDAEEKQERSYLVQDWIKKLKDVVYDADDVLDAVATRASQHQLLTQGWPKAKVSELFSPSNQVFCYKMNKKIEKIRKRLDNIAADMAKFNFRERIIKMQAGSGSGSREREQTHSFVLTSEVIGREKHREEIIQMLVASNSQENSIISIVGIGGLGKTTLAQCVYNDERVVKFFDRRIWVCVAEDFDIELVVRKILVSMTGCELGDLGMDQLQIRLRQNLNDRTYLLVLDDVWNENLEKWIRLKSLLVGGSPGSRILVTTRSRKVASIMGVNSPYLLKGLTDEKSWKFFQQIIFEGRKDELPANLIMVGKRIVERCKGVPLAIKTLASVMQFENEESDWLAIENSEIWRSSHESSGILPVLKLSYDHLPLYLRQCFSYCSVFPKSYRISKDQLVQLWMAQGYIPSSSGNYMEEVGYQYFNELLLRSFFQEVETDDCGDITSCTMHDLIHDLAQTVAGTDFSTSGIIAENVSNRVRHLSFDCSLYYAWEVPRHLLKVKGLRTFLLPVNHRWINKSSLETLISSFRHLRVLDVHCLGIEKLPSSIQELQHLRYLDISNNIAMKKLPNSVCNLHNLQTLQLSRCELLVELPSDIRKLVNLRHIVIDRCPRLACMPKGLGELTSLRTLSRFIVPLSRGTGSCVAMLSELNGLNFLRGGIWLKNLECLADVDLESREANLKGKVQLHFLGLHWAPNPMEGDASESKELVLRNLEPPPNLKQLWVEGYGGVIFSNWLSSLRNVVKITIRNCPHCQYLPPLDQLPALKFLHLHKLTALEYIEYSSKSEVSSSELARTCFPSLQELWLYKLPRFIGWQRRGLFNDHDSLKYLQDPLPRVPQLIVERCSKLAFMPFFVGSLQLINSSAEVTASSSLSILPSSPSPFSMLESLSIDKDERLLCLPEEGFQNLTSLKKMSIKNCQSLVSLSPGINFLTELTFLELRECGKLNLSNDNEMRWEFLMSLQSLIIDFLPQEVSLPEGLQCVTTLLELKISCCYNLETLPEWLGNLSLLQELDIADCSSLKSSLPESMSDLTSLQKLRITNCPGFPEKCERNTGEDWSKIAHIPEIEVTCGSSKPIVRWEGKVSMLLRTL